MTKRDTECKRAAKRAMKENGFNVPMTAMILLECGYKEETFCGKKYYDFDYVMFEDKKDGRQYQCRYGAKYYNHELDTLWEVWEYEA